MASPIVDTANNSLDLFRKQKQGHPKHHHLHSRWGDLSITAPTDGAWSQANQPNIHKKVIYGPGFVPDCDEDLGERSADHGDDSIVGQRRISVLKPRHLSRVLAPLSHNMELDKKWEEQRKTPESSFRPRQGCINETSEEIIQPGLRHFRYIPVRMRQGLSEIDRHNELGNIPRSHSCGPMVNRAAARHSRKISQPHDSRELVGRPSSVPATTDNGSIASSANANEEYRGRRSYRDPGFALRRSPSERKHGRLMTLTMVADDLW
jgi:hypothetical protein